MNIACLRSVRSRLFALLCFAFGFFIQILFRWWFFLGGFFFLAFIISLLRNFSIWTRSFRKSLNPSRQVIKKKRSLDLYKWYVFELRFSFISMCLCSNKLMNCVSHLFFIHGCLGLGLLLFLERGIFMMIFGKRRKKGIKQIVSRRWIRGFIFVSAADWSWWFDFSFPLLFGWGRGGVV